MKQIYLFLLILTFLLPLFSQDRYGLKFSKIEWTKLSQRKPVLRKKKVPGAPWPEVKVYSLINASPEESMAVYFDYSEHKDYIPDLLRSDPIKYISSTDIEVSFEVSLSWPLANSKFITGNQLSKLKNGGYQIHWYPVTHTSAKDCTGEIMFLPFRRSTLLVYRNFTFPNSSLASLFKNRMFKNIKVTISAIVKRIESVKKEGGPGLAGYIRNLNKALHGEYIYKNISRIIEKQVSD